MIKNKDFYVLLLGRLITNFGDSLYAIASTLLVYQMSGSTVYSGITLFLTSSTAIVQLLLSPILERINMKKFLIQSQLIQAILILIIPALYYLEKLNVYHIMIIMPIVSLINQLVYPGQISLLPKILSEKELVKKNILVYLSLIILAIPHIFILIMFYGLSGGDIIEAFRAYFYIITFQIFL